MWKGLHVFKYELHAHQSNIYESTLQSSFQLASACLSTPGVKHRSAASCFGVQGSINEVCDPGECKRKLQLRSNANVSFVIEHRVISQPASYLVLLGLLFIRIYSINERTITPAAFLSLSYLENVSHANIEMKYLFDTAES